MQGMDEYNTSAFLGGCRPVTAQTLLVAIENNA